MKNAAADHENYHLASTEIACGNQTYNILHVNNN